MWLGSLYKDASTSVSTNKISTGGRLASHTFTITSLEIEFLEAARDVASIFTTSCLERSWSDYYTESLATKSEKHSWWREKVHAEGGKEGEGRSMLI